MGPTFHANVVPEVIASERTERSCLGSTRPHKMSWMSPITVAATLVSRIEVFRCIAPAWALLIGVADSYPPWDSFGALIHCEIIKDS